MCPSRGATAALVAVNLASLSDAQQCAADVCERCCVERVFNCSHPGLQYFAEGQYQGFRVNYLSFRTETSTPSFKLRAQEFEACTGGQIIFAEAQNIWEDALRDLGTKDRDGLGIYHAYLMSYAHFPVASALNMAEGLDERLVTSNPALQWETVFPQVQQMGKYRKNNSDRVEFLMYDGDFFVPIVRLDLLERDGIPLPNTWEEALAIAKRYNNTDLNDDGIPDFGMCHFPRDGDENWDLWWPELVYSIWATYSQVKDSRQGFMFDVGTLEPQLGSGFSRAVQLAKEFWQVGADACENFITGRCAVGFAPPMCWKGLFQSGISRTDANGTVWRPTMQDGSYAEPYRFKPFGSTEMDVAGLHGLQECGEPARCPLAEVIPPQGHHGNDRASVLPESPLAGKLINRAPFFWSGGLGMMIRKSAPANLKNLVWDFMVYTNSAYTSAQDIPSGWLDSWRAAQLPPDGAYFRQAGWSQVAYNEHRNIMQWAMAAESNVALSLRLKSTKSYTYLTLAMEMRNFIAGEIDETELIRRVAAGWNHATEMQGVLDQLAIYRAGLGLDALQESELCLLHRDHMDAMDISICKKYQRTNEETYVIALIVVISLLVLAALMGGVAFFVSTAQAKRRLWKEKEEQLESTVAQGLATVRELGYPMAILPAKDFARLSGDELEQCHEGLRDLGLLRVLDSSEEIQQFHAMGNHIVFFSYHWPSSTRLGPDQVQRRAMNHALELYSDKVGADMENIFIWLDIVSIPQKHRGVQVLAINSLYVYASSVDALIIIAPPTVQEQTGEKLGLESYKNRVWTRVEQIAHLSAHGMESLFFYQPNGLEPVDLRWLEDVVRVFDASTTCCTQRHQHFGKCDRESLVLPLIGLYYRVAAAERRGVDSNEGTATLYEMMESKRDNVFPRIFEHVSVVNGQEVRKKKVLFGDLLERVDKHLQGMDTDLLMEFVRHPTDVSVSSARRNTGLMSPFSGRGGVCSATLSADRGVASATLSERTASVEARGVASEAAEVSGSILSPSLYPVIHEDSVISSPLVDDEHLEIITRM
ncbi:unnamed protein product [Effrenium voratum]|uniref:Uncharacterized protein n=1 Tax=Effrenium voratum TaxID=2562239 RepID=A0AA36I597_9DINO|nr:unnamed protein product [Effrenium voratum]